MQEGVGRTIVPLVYSLFEPKIADQSRDTQHPKTRKPIAPVAESALAWLTRIHSLLFGLSLVPLFAGSELQCWNENEECQAAMEFINRACASERAWQLAVGIILAFVPLLLHYLWRSQVAHVFDMLHDPPPEIEFQPRSKPQTRENVRTYLWNMAAQHRQRLWSDSKVKQFKTEVQRTHKWGWVYTLASSVCCLALGYFGIVHVASNPTWTCNSLGNCPSECAASGSSALATFSALLILLALLTIISRHLVWTASELPAYKDGDSILRLSEHVWEYSISWGVDSLEVDKISVSSSQDLLRLELRQPSPDLAMVEDVKIMYGYAKASDYFIRHGVNAAPDLDVMSLQKESELVWKGTPLNDSLIHLCKDPSGVSPTAWVRVKGKSGRNSKALGRMAIVECVIDFS